MSEKELLIKAQQGDDEAMLSLLEAHRPLIKRLVKHYYIKGAETEDLIQEGMIALFQAIKKYNVDANTAFTTFLNVVVRNRISSVIESTGRLKNQPLNNAIFYSEGLSEDSEHPITLLDQLSTRKEEPEELVIQHEETKEIAEFIRKQFSSFERTVLAYHLLGYSSEQIASKLDRTVKAVENALQRARKKLD